MAGLPEYRKVCDWVAEGKLTFGDEVEVEPEDVFDDSTPEERSHILFANKGKCWMGSDGFRFFWRHRVKPTGRRFDLTEDDVPEKVQDNAAAWLYKTIWD